MSISAEQICNPDPTKTSTPHVFWMYSMFCNWMFFSKIPITRAVKNRVVCKHTANSVLEKNILLSWMFRCQILYVSRLRENFLVGSIRKITYQGLYVEHV